MHRLPSFRRFSRALLVVLALAIGFAGGSAFVAFGASGDTYYACITAKGDIYRVRRNASWSCLAGDTKISWNQQGPQGVPGQRGPAGESAQTKVTTRSFDIEVPAQSSGGYDAPCEAGEVAIGGGFLPDAVPTGFSWTGSGPELNDGVAYGWTVLLVNPDDDTPGTGTVHVTCLAA